MKTIASLISILAFSQMTWAEAQKYCGNVLKTGETQRALLVQTDYASFKYYVLADNADGSLIQSLPTDEVVCVESSTPPDITKSSPILVIDRIVP